MFGTNDVPRVTESWVSKVLAYKGDEKEKDSLLQMNLNELVSTHYNTI